MLKTLSLMLILATYSMAANELTVPVVVGEVGGGELDACTSLGAVTGLKPSRGNFLSVRAGPGTNYSRIDQLHEGDHVHLCSNSKDNQWHGIVYSHTPGQDCGVGTPIVPAAPYKGPCASGWVNARWIVVIAG